MRCPICNKIFDQMTPAHAKKHNMTMKEMRDTYGNAYGNKPIKSPLTKARGDEVEKYLRGKEDENLR